MEILDLPVEHRDKLGSANARRYRRAGHIPVILYGAGQDNVPLVVTAEKFADILAAHTLLIRLKLGDDVEQLALIREVSWDVFSEHVQHIDLTRVRMEDEVQVTVPIHLHGVPEGVAQGGVLEPVITDLEVYTRVDSIPGELVVDVTPLDVHQGIHVDELTYPEHVRPARGGRDLIVHCVRPKKIEEPVVDVEEAAAAPVEGEEPKAEGDAAEPAASKE